MINPCVELCYLRYGKQYSSECDTKCEFAKVVLDNKRLQRSASYGKWTEASDGDGIVCSVCGEDFCTIVHETERFRYCPNCGARMDAE